jgi:hypothetical protein
MAGRRWSELSPGARRAILLGGAVDGVLRIAALVDLRRRPAGQVQGPKWAWGTALAVLSSAGVAPLVYFCFGRRRR